jgi:16S rRNA C1402 (ribose-2'-O) methylase RsmI
MFEETNKNSLAALAAHYEAKPPKGEIVIVIEGAPPRKHKDKYALTEEEDNEEEDTEDGE